MPIYTVAHAGKKFLKQIFKLGAPVPTRFPDKGQIWHESVDPRCVTPCQISLHLHRSILLLLGAKNCKVDHFCNYWGSLCIHRLTQQRKTTTTNNYKPLLSNDPKLFLYSNKLTVNSSAEILPLKSVMDKKHTKSIKCFAPHWHAMSQPHQTWHGEVCIIFAPRKRIVLTLRLARGL